MPNLKQILINLKKEEGVIPNPFDDVTHGNFWFEKNHKATVESIHESTFSTIESQLKLFIKSQFRQAKTILLTGDAGSGKSHLLGSLKNKLNSEAYFVYIQPIEDYRYFWRHILQYTVTSLMQIPEGETESQLQLWLKSLPVFNSPDWVDKLLGQKKAFVRLLKNTYPAGIVEARKFFSILYELTTENYDLACDWLAGEDLDEEDLQILGVRKPIDNEKLARGIFSNFGRITDTTKPIIICFDQIERACNNVFNINTTFHNERLVNFLILISITRENWQTYKKTMLQSDIARINETIFLDDITLEEAKQLWINHLQPLHLQSNPQPNSSIYPLKEEILAKNALGERINLRVALNLAGKNFQEFINTLPEYEDEDDKIPPPRPYFLQKWEQVFKESEEREKSIVLETFKKYSDEEFLEMFRYIFQCLGIENINPKFLNGKNATKGFTFTCPKTGTKKGFIVNNTCNRISFTAFMKECKTVWEQNECQQLILIRNFDGPKERTQIGAQIYQNLFKPMSKTCIRQKLKIEDLHYLFTYQKMYKDAVSGDLFINFKQISTKELLSDMSRYNILNNAQVLQNLGLVKSVPEKSVIENNINAILVDRDEISFSEFYNKVKQDINFYNYFISPYFLRALICNLHKNKSVLKIINPKDLFTEWRISPL